MKTQKNSQKEPVASPPNPERRKFLRDVLLAGALAPLACSREPSETSRRITLFQNRPFQLGSISIVLTACREGEEFPSASINIYGQGGSGLEHSVSMLVPGPFKFQGDGFEYELYVEGISYGTPNSANAILMKKGALQNEGKRGPEGADLFTIGAGAALLASIFLAIFERKSRVPEEGIALPPKRGH